MGYATYADYKALYGESKLDEAGFTRLIWEAERLMDAWPCRRRSGQPRR